MLNCYNTYNTHKEGTTWIIKIKRILSQNILFGLVNPGIKTKNTISRVNKHKTLTMVSLRAGNTSALCNAILGILIARECRILCNLATCPSHRCFGGYEGSGLQQSYWYALRVQCDSIQLAIFVQIRTITYISELQLPTCHIASAGYTENTASNSFCVVAKMCLQRRCLATAVQKTPRPLFLRHFVAS
jgi:hypothetical protein